MKIPICPHCKYSLYNNFGPCNNCGTNSLEEVQREATPQEIAEIKRQSIKAQSIKAQSIFLSIMKIALGIPIIMLIMGIMVLIRANETKDFVLDDLVGFTLLATAYKWIIGICKFLTNR